MTVRLLIVEDDPEITSALIRGLALIGYHGEAESRAGRALMRIKTEAFSGAIVDVMLGDDSGLDLVRAVRKAGVTFPIVMLSALADVEHRAAGLEAGADDYVVKPFDLDEFLARIRVQQHRAVTQRSNVAKLVLSERAVAVADRHVALTEREFALLKLLVRQGGQPVSRGKIFDTLWSAENAGNENVVDVYIGYLRRKLRSDDFGFEIRTIRNKGFCIAGQVPLLDER